MRAWIRLAGGALVLAILLWHFGSGPFTEAFRVTTWPAVLAALILTGLTTLTSAWRWRTVAAAYGVPLSRRESLTAYYRSQFLNSTLPGGILGDAHRAVRHGRDAGDVPAGLRATVWERASGQVVQLVLVLLALTVLASPLRPLTPLAAGAVLVVAVLGWTLLRRGGRLGSDLRLLLVPATLVRVVAGSGGSALGHLAVFLVAVHTVGVDASWGLLIPVGLVVMVGSSVPVNVAGWGPREGLTAWAFGLAGLGSAAGLTVSVVYGVLAAVATLPGALVLVSDAVTRRRTTRREAADALRTTAPAEGVELEAVRRG